MVVKAESGEKSTYYESAGYDCAQDGVAVIEKLVRICCFSVANEKEDEWGRSVANSRQQHELLSWMCRRSLLLRSKLSYIVFRSGYSVAEQRLGLGFSAGWFVAIIVCGAGEMIQFAGGSVRFVVCCQ